MRLKYTHNLTFTEARKTQLTYASVATKKTVSRSTQTDTDSEIVPSDSNPSDQHLLLLNLTNINFPHPRHHTQMNLLTSHLCLNQKPLMLKQLNLRFQKNKKNLRSQQITQKFQHKKPSLPLVNRFRALDSMDVISDVSDLSDIEAESPHPPRPPDGSS